MQSRSSQGAVSPYLERPVRELAEAASGEPAFLPAAGRTRRLAELAAELAELQERLARLNPPRSVMLRLQVPRG